MNGVIGVNGVNGVIWVIGVNGGDWGVWGEFRNFMNGHTISEGKALDSNLNNSINEFRNFMNTWSQQQEQDKNYMDLLLTGYECKPVKTVRVIYIIHT